MKITCIISIIMAIMLNSLLAEKILYRSRSYIAPRKIIRNEVTPEKAAAKRRKLKEARERRIITSRLSIRHLGARTYIDKKGRLFSNDKTLFRMNALDTESGIERIEYKIDRGDFQVFVEPFSIKKEGQHTIVFRAIDRSGNVEGEKIFSVIIDKTQPSILIMPDGEFYRLGDKYYMKPGASIRVRTSDRYSGVAEYYVDAGKGFLKSKNREYKFDTEREYIIRVVAIDNLKNRTKTKIFIIVIDNTPPVIEMKVSGRLRKTGNKLYCGRETSITIRASDTRSGVNRIQYRTGNDNKWRLYLQPIHISISSEKKFKIRAKAIDHAGNISSIGKIECIVDNDAPESKIEVLTIKGGKK